MALVLGTNCGFVTVAPDGDPDAFSSLQDEKSNITKDTSPSGSNIITEIGWYDNSGGTEEANFEVGLYADNAGTAAALLEVSRTNAKGTSAGWHRVTGLNWALSASTDYWICVQLDGTATTTNTDQATSGGAGSDTDTASTIDDPWGAGAGLANRMYAYYAKVEAGAPAGGTDPSIIGETII